MAEEIKTEKQSSIEINRNAKNEYSWKIKIYYDEEKRDWTSVVTIISDINRNLKERFT